MINFFAGAAVTSLLIAAANAVAIPLLWGASGWLLASIAPVWVSEAIRITTMPLTVDQVPGLFMLVGFFSVAIGAAVRCVR